MIPGGTLGAHIVEHKKLKSTTGPGSSTDNAVVRFDGASGLLFQNSGILIDDSDNITGVNNLTVNGDFTFGDAAADSMSINGDVTYATGSAITAASYQIQRDADATNQLHFNVPTGATMEWSVNDVAVELISAIGSVTHTQTAGTAGAVAFTITPGAHTDVTGDVGAFNIAAQTFTIDDAATVATLSYANIAALTVNGVAGGAAETVSLLNGLTIAAPITGTNVTVTETRVLNAAADTDVTNIFGRARIHSPNTDQAIFAHFDMTNNQQYALAQNATGQTVINAASGQSILFAIAGSSEITLDTTNLSPAANDGSALGISGTAFADLFLASGGVINWNAGDVTITHGTNLITIAGGDVAFSGRVLATQGADVASATDVTLGSDGNVFEITGTTQIDHIVSTGWQNGAEVTLVFNASLTVRHGIATSGANITILLAAATNFGATADDTLTLILCETTASGQAWREKGRAAI